MPIPTAPIAQYRGAIEPHIQTFRAAKHTRYRVCITRSGKVTAKAFHKLEAARKYRDKLLKKLPPSRRGEVARRRRNFAAAQFHLHGPKAPKTPAAAGYARLLITALTPAADDPVTYVLGQKKPVAGSALDHAIRILLKLTK